MKKTALYQSHIDLGAKMIPFAGYEMPVQYKGLNHEHQIVRNGVGICGNRCRFFRFFTKSNYQ
jgi:aminomethyltransferase